MTIYTIGTGDISADFSKLWHIYTYMDVQWSKEACNWAHRASRCVTKSCRLHACCLYLLCPWSHLCRLLPILKKWYESSLVKNWKMQKMLMRGTETVCFQYFNFPSITVQRDACVEMLLRSVADINSPWSQPWCEGCVRWCFHFPSEGLEMTESDLPGKLNEPWLA